MLYLQQPQQKKDHRMMWWRTKRNDRVKVAAGRHREQGALKSLLWGRWLEFQSWSHTQTLSSALWGIWNTGQLFSSWWVLLVLHKVFSYQWWCMSISSWQLTLHITSCCLYMLCCSINSMTTPRGKSILQKLAASLTLDQSLNIDSIILGTVFILFYVVYIPSTILFIQ